MRTPLDLMSWIAENASRLKPPVGNAQISEGRDFIVTVVGGPNARTDYHDDPYEEFFFQIKGDITLRLQDDGSRRDVTIREGQLFVLPARIRHSPQRPEGTIGLIIERRRGDVAEAFEWYCERCNQRLHREEAYVKSFDELPTLLRRFTSAAHLHQCPRCQYVNRG